MNIADHKINSLIIVSQFFQQIFYCTEKIISRQTVAKVFLRSNKWLKGDSINCYKVGK